MRLQLTLLALLSVLAFPAVAQDPTLDLPIEPKKWEQWVPAKDRPKGELPEPRADEPFQDGPEYVPLYGDKFPVEDSIVFVLDRSSSMDYPSHVDGEETRWEILQRQMVNAIKALRANLSFSIVEFTCTHRMLWKELRPATADNKKQAISWLMNLEPSWSTGTGPAVVTALAFNPGGVVLITDGEPNCGLQPGEHRDLIRRANTGIRVDVIGVGVIRYTRAWCQQIASQNGGVYIDAS